MLLNKYVGTYYDKGYGYLNISLKDKELYMPVSFKVVDEKVKSVAVRFESMVPDIIFEKI